MAWNKRLDFNDGGRVGNINENSSLGKCSITKEMQLHNRKNKQFSPVGLENLLTNHYFNGIKW